MMESEIAFQSAVYHFDANANKNTGITVVVGGVEMTVPLDPNNRHYAEILRQVEAGTLVIQETE